MATADIPAFRRRSAALEAFGGARSNPSQVVTRLSRSVRLTSQPEASTKICRGWALA